MAHRPGEDRRIDALGVRRRIPPSGSSEHATRGVCRRPAVQVRRPGAVQPGSDKQIHRARELYSQTPGPVRLARRIRAHPRRHEPGKWDVEGSTGIRYGANSYCPLRVAVLPPGPDSCRKNQLMDGGRTMRYSTGWLWDEFATEPGGDLAIFDHDEGFPFPLSPFRRVEYTSYLRRYPRAAVFAYSPGSGCGSGRTGLPAARPALPPDVADRVRPIPHLAPRPGRHALAYCVFLSNAARFVERFEMGDVPFCFTLYPGGGFQLNDDRSDHALRRVCSSPLFRGVIVTQSV